PSILWTAVVGESGTAKTPAFRLALNFVRKVEGKALKRHQDEVQDFEVKEAHYEREFAEWKKGTAGAGDPPEKPEMPQPQRFIVGDVTMEALAPILLANPRGVLLARDELAG